MSAAAEVLTVTSVGTLPPAPSTPLPPPPSPVAAGATEAAPPDGASDAAPPDGATDAGPPVQHTVHWFRKGLRLHDNPSLREGLVNAATFRCVFLIDPWFASSSNVGINKWRFLLQCLEDLDASLRKLNSRLFVVRGQPTDALPKLFKEWGTTSLTFEEDPEPYGRVRDRNMTTKCREIGVKVISCVSHTLFKLDQIIENNGGKAPLTYHQFQALIASMPAPPAAVPTVCLKSLNGATTPIGDDHDVKFGVPTLEELGFNTVRLKAPAWVGGESEALTRLERHLQRKAWVASFGLPKMTPQSLLASKTGLSPYLRFGCLSTRLFYSQLTELYQEVKKVQPPLSLHGQILWREFFYCAATRNPNFDRMHGNPICVQIPWEENKEALVKWGNGQTGYPWIDAIMIQLREEGWIHHLSRHAVACFLTRGDLWISWEDGMKVFEEYLLDADWSVNAGTWMWLSCSSFFQQFFHCYCPVRFGRKTDPNGDFIRRYIPVLKDMPTRYIHSPWMAPDEIQKAAKCVVGRDYPVPMVDHNKASLINIERIKQVYAQLAQYRPQGSLILNAVERPTAAQSSPSPTSIIARINMSNYLCSQSAPDPTPAPQVVPCKDSDIFQRPMNPVYRHSKYKENVNAHNAKKTSDNLQKTFVANGKIDTSVKIYQTHLETPPTSKQENYDFKNLAINNNVQTQSHPVQNESQGVMTKSNPIEYQQAMKVNNFNYEKKFYLPVYPEKVARQRTPTSFMSCPTEYIKSENNESEEDKNDPFNSNADESQTGESEQNTM